MPLLQVPAGEEGGPKGLPNLLKEEDKEEDEEEKKEEDDDQEEMEGNRRDEEDKQESLVVEEGMIIKVPLSPCCHLSTSPAASASRFFPTRRS